MQIDKQKQPPDINEQLKQNICKRYSFHGDSNTLTPVDEEYYNNNKECFVQLKQNEQDYNIKEIAYLLYQDYETNLYISLNKNDTDLPSVTRLLQKKIETWPCVSSDLLAIVHDEVSSYNSYYE